MSRQQRQSSARRVLAPGAVATLGPLAIVRDGDDFIVASDCERVVRANGHEAFATLRGMQQTGGFWVGAMTYDLARAVERIPTFAADDRGFDDLTFAKFGTVQRFSSHEVMAVLHEPDWRDERAKATLGPMTTSLDRAQYERQVEAIHGHLAAGDCYQVNLTRRLNSPLRAEATQLFGALAADRPAPHCALLRFDDIDIVSASPELFMRLDGRVVQTRPIKGTGASEGALRHSAKDHAEHIMIVDLARNDLGRVCEYGTVTVPALQYLEHHPGLVHMVSTVRGTVRPSVDIAELVRAAFPAASITGAPKPKVLELIESLEPVRRGYYCGSVGWIDFSKETLDLSVAIRTFTMSQHGTDFAVGGGIVWDSVASSEWDETSLKAAHILRTVGAFEAEPQYADLH